MRPGSGPSLALPAGPSLPSRPSESSFRVVLPSPRARSRGVRRRRRGSSELPPMPSETRSRLRVSGWADPVRPQAAPANPPQPPPRARGHTHGITASQPPGRPGRRRAWAAWPRRIGPPGARLVRRVLPERGAACAAAHSPRVARPALVGHQPVVPSQDHGPSSRAPTCVWP